MARGKPERDPGDDSPAYKKENQEADKTLISGGCKNTDETVAKQADKDADPECGGSGTGAAPIVKGCLPQQSDAVTSPRFRVARLERRSRSLLMELFRLE